MDMMHKLQRKLPKPSRGSSYLLRSSRQSVTSSSFPSFRSTDLTRPDARKSAPCSISKPRAANARNLETWIAFVADEAPHDASERGDCGRQGCDTRTGLRTVV